MEATKFTEVGFHGRDVDQIIRDLVDNAIIMMRQVGRRGGRAARRRPPHHAGGSRGCRGTAAWPASPPAAPSLPRCTLPAPCQLGTHLLPLLAPPGPRFCSACGER